MFEDKFVDSLQQAVVQLLENNKRLTYLTHRTTFSFEGKKKDIISHKQNARTQQVVYDLTFENDWWNQTSDTVKQWADSYIYNNINPIFTKYIKVCETLPPFVDEPNCWIPFRWHINILEYTNFLSLHQDMQDACFNTKNSSGARGRALTFYLQDHIPEHGGEFWTENGFAYTPKRNTILSINGNQCLHGVSTNMNPDGKPRLAFTTRWAHKDDLFLPGDINKSIYNLIR